MSQFHIFKQNTDAIATNRGFYYQYLKTVKLWLANYIDGVDNEIYCEYEDDIFEQNNATNIYNFHQIKCYSSDSGLNSPNVKSSLLNFYMLYEKYDYKGEFHFESNTGFSKNAGGSLKKWYEQQQGGNYSVDAYIEETKEILKKLITDNLAKYLERKEASDEEKSKANTIADEFYLKLEKPSFKTFLESIRWSFSEESDTDKVINLLSTEILEYITSDELSYDNRVDKKLLFGCLVNTVLEKSIKDDEHERLLTNDILEDILTLTEINDSEFDDELKELINSLAEKNLTIKSSTHDISFVGREDELRYIDAQLESSDSLLLLNGIGGIGKSSLANYYLYTREDKFNYYGFIEGLGSFISEFRNSLNLKAKKEDELFNEIVYKLRQRKGKKLLIIDNVENIAENKQLLTRILSLRKYGYKILFTSRQKIKGLKKFHIGTLLPIDARRLFLDCFETEEVEKVDIIIEYLGSHTLFIKLTAETIVNEGYLLEDIIEKFKKGELSKIEFIDNESGAEVTFNNNLQELFSMQNLNDKYVLLLKRLAILPSIDIELSFLEEMLGKERLKGKLNFLVGRGWITYEGTSYKLHSIIKEFILSNYSPTFEEIEDIVDSFTPFVNNDNIKKISYSDNHILYFKSLVRISKKFSYDNKKIIYPFLGLGSSYMHLSLYKESLTIFEETLVFSEKILDDCDPLNAEVYSSLALIYMKIGKYELSIYFGKKSLKNAIYTFGLSHIFTVGFLNNLAFVYKTTGIYKKALPLYFKALMISKKNTEDTDITATLHTNLSQLYKEKGEYKKALYHAKESVRLCEEIYSLNHTSTAVAYNNTAEIYRVLFKYDKAMHLYQKALEINESIFGVLHEETATNYNNIAMIHEANKDYEDALLLYKKALDIREQLLGVNHRTTGTSYHNLGMLYRFFKRYDEALRLVKIDLNISEKSLGKYHIDTLTSYNSLGIIYLDLKLYQESYNFFKKVIEISNKMSLFNHPLVNVSKRTFRYVEEQLKIQTVMNSTTQKIGRNSPCPCKSGKKYKQCCGNTK